LAVVSIAAAAFFGWQVKSAHTDYIGKREGLQDRNKKITGKIEEQTKNRAISEKQRDVALDAKEEAVARLDSAKSNYTGLKATLSQADTRLDEANARINKVDKFIAELKKQVPGDIRIEDVPDIVKDLREEKKQKDKTLEELDIVREKLQKDVVKLKDSIVRAAGKIEESKKRVAANDFEASVAAVNNDWGFLIIGAGENSGLTGQSKLLVKRAGRLVGKVAISSLEANQAVAEVVPGSLGKGVVIQAGDRVILEEVNPN